MLGDGIKQIQFQMVVFIIFLMRDLGGSTDDLKYFF